MAEEKKSFIARMRARINRPGSWLSYDLANLVPGRKIDAEVLDELETRLLTADVGVDATQHILEELRKKVARAELADVDALIAALTDAITAILLPSQKPPTSQSVSPPQLSSGDWQENRRKPQPCD